MGKHEESVLVVVRCRPLSEKEVNQELESGISNPDDNADSDDKNDQFYSGCVKVTPNLGLVEIKNPKSEATDPPKQFTFDAAYNQGSKQKDLYEETFAPLVNSVLEGFNGTIFAYGQTGAGKTFTMEGVRDDPEMEGVIPRSFRHIFDRIATAPEDERYLVRASYLEIYQEEIRDLISKDHETKRLELRERPDSGVYVKDLKALTCKCQAEIEHVMKIGNLNRSVGATNMNEYSSRSHAIFLVTVERSKPDPDSGESHICVGKLNLVDLAGSERQAKTGATGDRLKEATKINLSLSALGNVISALVEGGKGSHIPYRDSKLTRLLQDSLGGNAKTVMVANIGPSKFNYDETLTTLRYANRAKNIKNKPRVNEDPKDAKLREFQEEIARLKAQIANTEGGRDKRKKSARSNKNVKKSTNSIDESMECSSLLGSISTTSTSSSTIASPIEDMEHRIAVERELLESDTTIIGAEKEKLRMELNNKEVALKKEKSEQEGLKNQLEKLESQLLSGTGSVAVQSILNNEANMVDHTNEQQKILEIRKKEVAERRRAQHAAAQELEQIEDLGKEMEKTYGTLQNEVETKTRKLRKLFTKLQTFKQEIVDVTEEYNRDRRDLEETQQQLLKELKLKMLISDNFIPPTDKQKIVSRAIFDEDKDVWILQTNSKTSGSAISKRPVSAAGSRRPMSEYARVQSGLRPGFAAGISGSGSGSGSAAALRFKGENIMRLSLDRGGRTTKDYEGPQVAPRVQAALDAAMANVEPDIELDVKALNGHNNLVKGTRKPKKNNQNNAKAYPSPRGLVPK